MAKTDYHIFVENGKVGLKDATDRIVLFAVYDGIVFTDTDTPVCVCRDGKWGLTDIQGWTIADAKYEYMSTPCNGSMAVRINDKWGFIDYKGKEIVPPIYEYAHPFINAEYCFGASCAWVKKNGKWGTVNTKGEVVIPFEYDRVNDINGKSIVEKDGKYGIVNHKNEFVIPMDDVEMVFIDKDIVSIFEDDFICGAINLVTMERHEFHYDVEGFDEDGNYAVIYDFANHKYNVFDKKFNVLLPEWHDEIEMLYDGKALVRDEKEYFLYDCASGKSEECRQDDNFVYFPDGKTIYLKYPGRDPLRIKSGVENLAYYAPNSVYHYLKKYQTSSNLTTLEFKEGVTTIGTGWEEIRESKSTYTPQVDIYLPSTLKTVNTDAFSRMITMIRSVYVPKGMIETMLPILPPHLRPFVKERGFISFLKNLIK